MVPCGVVRGGRCGVVPCGVVRGGRCGRLIVLFCQTAGRFFFLSTSTAVPGHALFHTSASGTDIRIRVRDLSQPDIRVRRDRSHNNLFHGRDVNPLHKIVHPQILQIQLDVHFERLEWRHRQSVGEIPPVHDLFGVVHRRDMVVRFSRVRFSTSVVRRGFRRMRRNGGEAAL